MFQMAYLTRCDRFDYFLLLLFIIEYYLSLYEW